MGDFVIEDGLLISCNAHTTTVIIPDSVTRIGDAAFKDCLNLVNVIIPNSVTQIGEAAFKSSLSLKSVTIGSGVEGIYNYAFKSCINLVSVTIPDNVTWIGEAAFKSCSKLISVTIGSGVKWIGEAAFKSCSRLTSVTIGSGVTSIGEAAFKSCSKLTSVTIGSGVKSIAEYAFNSCSGLLSVTIPKSVTSIGNNAFSSCSSLTSVTIGSSVTSIGEYAFSSCSSLLSVTIPKSVTVIGNNAFSSCSSLTNVTIGSGVKSIGDYAFRFCSSLKSVTIPDSVTSIGRDSFMGCKKLKNITIPNTTIVQETAWWEFFYWPKYKQQFATSLFIILLCTGSLLGLIKAAQNSKASEPPFPSDIPSDLSFFYINNLEDEYTVNANMNNDYYIYYNREYNMTLEFDKIDSIQGYWNGSNPRFQIETPFNKTIEASTRSGTWPDKVWYYPDHMDGWEFKPTIIISLSFDEKYYKQWISSKASLDFEYPYYNKNNSGFSDMSGHVEDEIKFFVISDEDKEMIVAYQDWKAYDDQIRGIWAVLGIIFLSLFIIVEFIVFVRSLRSIFMWRSKCLYLIKH